MTEIVQLELDHALAVVRGMRARDRSCVRALLGEIDDEVFAVNRWQTNGPAWTLMESGAPVAIFGLQLPNDWTAVAWLLATPSMASSSWRKLMRHSRTVAANVMAAGGAAFRHRVEAYVMADWAEAAEFAQRLGLHYEGTKRAAGSRGEDMQIWALTHEGVQE